MTRSGGKVDDKTFGCVTEGKHKAHSLRVSKLTDYD